MLDLIKCGGSCCVAVLLLAATTAAAAFPFRVTDPGALLQNHVKALPDELSTGARVAAPFGFVKLCIDHPAVCRNRSGAASERVRDGRMRLTPHRLRQITSANQSVNRSIQPVADGPQVDDIWQVNVRRGDCEEFALAKRRALMSLGWPSSAAVIALVRTRRGEAHAVLVARTDHGDLVLDNLNGAIKTWRQTGYRFTMIQSPWNASAWLAIRRS